MAKRPLVSAVLPNYNDAATLGEALEALLSQSYGDLEVIVVDDGSKDNSVEVVEAIAKRDGRLRLFRHERNQGPIVAQLTGFAHATGTYVFGPSANDKVLPGFLDKLVGCMERHPDAGVGFCDLLCLDDPEKNEIADLGAEARYLPPHEVVDVLRERHAFLLGGTAVARRAAWQDAGWLVPSLRWMADFFAFHVIAFRHGLCHVPEALYAVRSPAYSGAGPKTTAQRQAVVSLLTRIESPPYADVRAAFHRSRVLSVVPGIVQAALQDRAHWHALTPGVLMRVLRTEAKNLARPLIPKATRRAYRQERVTPRESNVR